MRRLSKGRSPFSPDRGHIHHRLLDLGLTHTQTVLLIYAICIGLGLLSLVLSGTGQLYAFMGAFLVFGVVILVLDRVAEDRVTVDEAADAKPRREGRHAKAADAKTADAKAASAKAADDA